MINLFAPKIGSDKMTAFFHSFNHRIIMFTGFWGFEPAHSTPPNHIMTGPLLAPPEDLLTRLEQKDAKLLGWLDAAKDAGRPVLYVTIGSECKWQQWSVDEMYKGLKKTGYKVVWGLAGFNNPAEGDDDFWVSGWLPQVEALSHPAVKGGLTHCGFGGTNEFINATIPVLCWPHFGD